MNAPAAVEIFLDKQPYPLLFATISGAHLYGFPSEDSDYDLRGCHLLPLQDLVGLRKGSGTIDRTVISEGYELDLVTHDAEKFFGMMLKKDGSVLEQLYSPLVLRGGEDLERLRSIGKGCVTRHHVHHYLGFARNQWLLFAKENPPRIKPLLYMYRVLLTGIHLMRSGEVECSLPRLNESFALSYLAELIQAKREGAENERLKEVDLEFYRGEFGKLCLSLEAARASTTLPESAMSGDQLHDFLVELRLRNRRA